MQMTNSLHERGPDASGQWLSPHAALAHRRLIVIDPHSGDQPMVYQQGEQTYVLTYNGAIYNFRELHDELEQHGHTFRTMSDTEVILHAYVEWQEACVEHFNGIFALGLWDEQKQSLLLARDRLGVKPLFYVQRNGTFFFASELKALLTHPLIQAEVDASGLAEILTFVRTPGSGIYHDVHELRPAHILTYTQQGMRSQRYWNLRSQPHTDDLETTIETIRALLEDTVRHQLIADVPVATMLSGGLDSNVLTALAARELKKNGLVLHTYSIDFANSAQDFQTDVLHLEQDEPWARKASAAIGTQHHTIVVDSTALLENMLVQLQAYDMPMVGQMNTSLYLLFQHIKQQATVVLSGESADEIFGGYPWFHIEAFLKARNFPWQPAFLGTGESALTWLSPDILQSVHPTEHIGQQYNASILETPLLAGEDEMAQRRREMTYLNLTHWLPFLLGRKDRMSMATGLEARVPFGDHRLLEYVWNVPWNMKMVDQIEKGILRRACKDLLPEELIYRKKSAYPSVQNPGYEEATRKWALRILDDIRAPIQPLLNQQVTRNLLTQPGSGRSGIAQVSLFERIILLNEWLGKYGVTLSLS
jgi:asparagine synthase (glutamine-hydrolysing)